MIRSIETGLWAKDPFGGLSDSVALIDGDTYLYLASVVGDDFIAGRELIDLLIRKTLIQTGCRRYSGFLSDTGNLYRSRIAFTKPYKGNRKGKETPILIPSFRVYMMRAWGFYTCPSLEADDCVAYFGMNNQLVNARTVICSPDKDVLKQLPGRHYNYAKEEQIVTSSSDAARFLWEQVLTGDGVDGVPGIHGIGEVKAAQILEGVANIDYPIAVLQEYVSRYPIGEAVNRFKETFDLVHLPTTEDDFKRLHVDPPVLSITDSSQLYRTHYAQRK